MLLVSISVVLTIIVLNLHHGGPYTRPVPNWMRRIILFKLARLLRIDPNAVYARRKTRVSLMGEDDNVTMNEMKRTNRSRLIAESDSEFDMNEIPKLAYLDCPDSPLLSMHRMNGELGRGGSGSRKNTAKTDQIPSLREDTILLRRLLSQLLYFRERTERSDVTQTFLTEWKQVAVVVDRFFMVFYLVLSAATILIILTQVDTAEVIHTNSTLTSSN